MSRARVGLSREGLVLGGRTVPLFAGALHHSRIDPRDWPRAIASCRAMGLSAIDTVVPWSAHERAPRELDFGERDPFLDLRAFLRLVHREGLVAIVRPGPRVGGDLDRGGLPERIVWDEACMARSPSGHPVVLPALPLAHPIPSFASEAFLAEVEHWLESTAREIADLRWPDGPVVLVAIDDEGAPRLRDGVYDQDHHPDALAHFRSFLRVRHGDDDALRAAWSTDDVTIDSAMPPLRFDATSDAGLARHLDWAEAQEATIARALSRMKAALVRGGLEGVPFSHDVPAGSEVTPLDTAKIGAVVDLVGLDYRGRATELDRASIERRTTELALRSDAAQLPAFAAALRAGFAPSQRPVDANDERFAILSALAYGARAFSLHMAVARDRWVGAPIGADGRPREGFERFARLLAALDRLGFASLERRAPARLVVPSAHQRLARVMHAFGPGSGALFASLGFGADASALEDDLATGAPVALAGPAFVAAFRRALDRRGVAFAYVDGACARDGLEGARLVVCPSVPCLDRESYGELVRAADRGAEVVVGTRAPDRDEAMRPLELALDPRFVVADDLGAADAIVARAIERLALPTLRVEPESVHVALHHDRDGVARAAIVLSPARDGASATIRLPGVRAMVDLLDGTRHEVDPRSGGFTLRMAGRASHLFALEA